MRKPEVGIDMLFNCKSKSIFKHKINIHEKLLLL